MINPNSNDFNPYSATPQSTTPPVESRPSDRDATGGIIPYKNPKALVAYYLGILSGLPLIGLPIGAVAFVLGIMGLKDRKKNPAIKGSAHAWIGIGCGGFFALLWGLLLIIIIASLVFSKR